MYCLTRKSKHGKELGYLGVDETWVDTHKLLKDSKKADELIVPKEKTFNNKKEATDWLKDHMDEATKVSDLEDEDFIYKIEKASENAEV